MKTFSVPLHAACVLFVLFVLGGANATAATYYVSETGSDTHFGSRFSPWRTIQRAASSASAGDTVIVKDGVYQPFRVRAGGAPGHWITFKSETKHGAVIDGGVTTSKRVVVGIDVYRTEYIRLEDFEIRNCLIGVAVRGVSMADPSHDIYGYRLKIHSIGRSYVDKDCDDGGVNPWVGIFTQACTRRTTWDSCEVFDIGRLPGNCCYSAHVVPASDFFYDHNLYLAGDEHVVTNCLIYSAHAGWPIKLTSSSYAPPGRFSHRIINNTIAHAANRNFATSPICDPRNPVGHIELAGAQGTSEIYKVIIRNNVFYNPPGDYVLWQGGLDLSLIESFDHNVTSAARWVYQHQGSGSFNPIACTKDLALSSFGFSDAANNDFTLTDSATSLIDSGASELAPTWDHAGFARPQGFQFDIGAYELENSVPRPPTGLLLKK